jgi:hypothetical protein
MDETQAHLDAALRLALDGNHRLGRQLRKPIGPTSLAAYDAGFSEPGWPDQPGRQPLDISSRLIIAATAAAVDQARLLQHLEVGAGILTSELLSRRVLESAAIGTWVIRPGLLGPDDPEPEEPATFNETSQRQRVERAHLTRWLSMGHYDSGLKKDKDRRARIESWKADLGDRVSECEPELGKQTPHQLDSTVEAGLAKMARDLDKLTFGPPGRRRPETYSLFSAYGHPNIDSIIEMEGPDGIYERDADAMIHELWVALMLAAKGWEMLATYAGWDVKQSLSWRDELDEIRLLGT